MKPFVSVIMTAYNCADTVVNAINSVLDQTYDNIEVIIVEDHSTDSTFGVISNYYGRVKIISLPRNVGHTKALNIALKNASGEFIARQDSDDWSHLQRIERQLKYNGELGFDAYDIVFTYGVSVDDSGKVISNYYTDEGQRRPVEDIIDGLDKDCCFLGPSALIHRSVVDYLGEFDEECYFAQDLNYWKRAILVGFKIGVVPEELYYLRRHKSVRSTEKARERDWHKFAIERANERCKFYA